jgi:hypothetical protein
MTSDARLNWLRALLVVWGIGFAAVVGIGAFVRSLLRPYAGAEYDQMLQVVYFVLGVFLIGAARNPFGHLSLIRFTIWSSVAHAALMLVQAIAFFHPPGDPVHCANPQILLLGTAPLVLAAVSLSLVHPKADQPSNGAQEEP